MKLAMSKKKRSVSHVRLAYTKMSEASLFCVELTFVDLTGADLNMELTHADCTALTSPEPPT
jgi:hypothetical protein